MKSLNSSVGILTLDSFSCLMEEIGVAADFGLGNDFDFDLAIRHSFYSLGYSSSLIVAAVELACNAPPT